MTTSPTRTLNWPACYNVRDLGGLPTINGGVRRYGGVHDYLLTTGLTAGELTQIRSRLCG